MKQEHIQFCQKRLKQLAGEKDIIQRTIVKIETIQYKIDCQVEKQVRCYDYWVADKLIIGLANVINIYDYLKELEEEISFLEEQLNEK